MTGHRLYFVFNNDLWSRVSPTYTSHIDRRRQMLNLNKTALSQRLGAIFSKRNATKTKMKNERKTEKKMENKFWDWHIFLALYISWFDSLQLLFFSLFSFLKWNLSLCSVRAATLRRIYFILEPKCSAKYRFDFSTRQRQFQSEIFTHSRSRRWMAWMTLTQCTLYMYIHYFAFVVSVYDRWAPDDDDDDGRYASFGFWTISFQVSPLLLLLTHMHMHMHMRHECWTYTKEIRSKTKIHVHDVDFKYGIGVGFTGTSNPWTTWKINMYWKHTEKGNGIAGIKILCARRAHTDLRFEWARERQKLEK